MVSGEPAGFTDSRDAGPAATGSPGVLECAMRVVVNQLTGRDQMATNEFRRQLAQRAQFRAHGRVKQSGVGIGRNGDLLTA